MPPLTPPIPTPLAGSKFNLNSAGVAGFFGGEEAISAMNTVHLYRGRRWLGWFNSPGSYTIAKRFGRMANSRFWDGLFPGSNDSPAVSFGLDGETGPKYIAALSGTEMQTGHLAYLTMKRSKEEKAKDIEGRKTKPARVAYLAMKNVDYDSPIQLKPPTEYAPWAVMTIAISVVACIMCALIHDWYSFSMILLGIISSGLASCVIGKGKLSIKSVKEPAKGSPPGHGILLRDDIVVVIKGEERDVNAITKGGFELETDSEIRDEEYGAERCYHTTGFCSLLLIVQFLLQLLLIPQGSLFGQIMFLASLGISWVYNSYLSSLEKDKIQTDILFQALGGLEMRRYRVGTRTTMGVFVCLLLFHEVKVEVSKDRLEKILHSCLPNDTVVWQLWTKRVVSQLRNPNDESLSWLENKELEGDLPLSEGSDKKLFKVLLDDASAAFKGYFSIRGELPSDSSQSVMMANEK